MSEQSPRASKRAIIVLSVCLATLTVVVFWLLLIVNNLSIQVSKLEYASKEVTLPGPSQEEFNNLSDKVDDLDSRVTDIEINN